ncbi:2-amino-4-hydroxy-6-hydroxymethyldihydropteridine diphosphokinase [Aestuariivita boseongensis]|uniref:2-amino-4-hydroxy-6- hydroxymethyldihydropteridine diphosphokinase n=1 Tax=Aestuariivita boseongensis TaxID=1470562 RepID=UPI000681387F|nr:2-amino-4-hydroxy-6-hydroxymethyldihydropteridine diphosphokinase [Aestuariivita boseongensis]
MNEIVSIALVALGSNLPDPEGDPTSNLKRALMEMASEGLVIRSVSRFFETPCFPAGAGPDYVNAAVSVGSSLDPRGILEALHRVEARMGRTRDTRWGMRTLDLDLIAVGDAVLPDAETVQSWMDLPAEEQKLRAPDALVLPHPRLADRAFVLTPLADIAPDWRHPLSGLSVREMLAALPDADRREVRAI